MGDEEVMFLEMFPELFLSFLAYSFLGWVCESIYCSIGQKKLVNRGFLTGPLCPVYGFGAMAVLLFLRPFKDNVVELFFAGMLLTSVIEYITAYLLEKLFAAKWWDYSTYRFNIHGRVCLRNSLMFGALSVFAARCVDPRVQGMIQSLPYWLEITFSSVFAVLLVTDLTLTVHTILKLNGTLKQIQQLVEQTKLDTAEYLRQNHLELQQKMEQGMLDWELGKMELKDYLEDRKSERAERREERRRELLSKLTDEQREALDRLENHIHEVSGRNNLLRRRLLEAFPNMHSTRYEQGLQRIRAEIRHRREK